ncbi:MULTISPECIES: hypothetical protein [Levilactobacillus]|uniref:Uncharacterized protein n=1 Tax=Levilactobacillus suantsaiihabitans TaxID=2487722 RepID=A0A4Z0JCX4_9LACO|nr:hypothetical protein [Levilactobacillus suantsaiihabitans]TGD19472.1 hypothetical protein EGT51_04710 [Levilactobacillus suantsaiihabitans]
MKRKKRIRLLSQLYLAVVNLGLLPLVLLFVFMMKEQLESNGILVTLIGAQAVRTQYLILWIVFMYLVVYLMYYLLKGMYLFDWELVNLFNSLRATFNVRYSLFRQPSRLDADRVVRDFNLAVKRATLSIWDDVLELVIPLPRTVGAQKMFDMQSDELRQRISLMFPQYAMSSFEQEGMTLVLVGSRH